MPKHIFVELKRQNDDDETIYHVIEDYIKRAVVSGRSSPGSGRSKLDRVAELKINNSLISDTTNKENYQIPPELIDVLRTAKIASDLHAFVFRQQIEN